MKRDDMNFYLKGYKHLLKGGKFNKSINFLLCELKFTLKAEPLLFFKKKNDLGASSVESP